MTMWLIGENRKLQRGTVWILPSRHGRIDLCFSFLVRKVAQWWDISLAETVRHCVLLASTSCVPFASHHSPTATFPT